MKTTVRSTLTALFLGSFAVISATATAAEGNVAHTVNFGDLDLTRESGVTVLYTRIRSAATEVCEPRGVRELNRIMIAHRCMDEAIGRAVDDVNAPTLTNYHRARMGAPIIIAGR